MDRTLILMLVLHQAANGEIVRIRDVRDGSLSALPFAPLDGIYCLEDHFLCVVPGHYQTQCVQRHFLPDFCRRSVFLPCTEFEFRCQKTRRCIPRHSVHDNLVDCSDFYTTDDSDEQHGPYTSCNIFEFRCQQTGRCIPREWVKDGSDDCPEKHNSTIIDTSDENGPIDNINLDYEFRCNDNGRLISRQKVKDDITQCFDGSDEIYALTQCNHREFRCADTGRCIPKEWIGDGIEQCPDGSDERVGRNLTCDNGYFLCRNGRRCLPKRLQCDGIDHCGDCTDEIEACGEAPRMWRCPQNKSICVQQSYACDQFADCPGGSDSVSGICGFKCKFEISVYSSYCTVPQSTLHDDVSVCSDESDVCFSEGGFKCRYCGDRSTIISQKQLCDGIVDCQDLWDECLCMENKIFDDVQSLCHSISFTDNGSHPVESQRCRRGNIHCPGDGKCISKSQVCDKVVDCPTSGIDEKFCTKGESKTEKNYSCLPVLRDISLLSISAREKFYPEKAAQCDGVVECALFEDECSSNCTNRMTQCDEFPLTLDFIGKRRVRSCPHETKAVLGIGLCDGFQDCGNGDDEKDCANRHYCAGKFVTGRLSLKNFSSISKDQVCDTIIDCKDSTDEMNCSETTHFYCCNGEPLFVPIADVRNGKTDCTDNSDECPEYACDGASRRDGISSREEMISSPFLRFLLWIMAIVALLGNVFVICEAYYIEFILRTQSIPLGKCNRLLIVNLAFADFLMALALIMIGIKSSILSGNYCVQETIWKTSGVCSFIGVLIVTSSQASVYTLVVLTFYRFYGVYRPYQSRYFKIRTVYILIAVGWFMACFLAVLPLIPVMNQSMVTHALITPSPFFAKTIVSWKELHEFTIRSVVLGNINKTHLNDISTWGTVKQLLKNTQLSDHTPNITGYFGYYSSDGVCIPRLFKMGDSPHLHPLALFTVIINFLCLVFITGAYCTIYRLNALRAGRVRSSGPHESQNNVMQRKITILIATDFCCWLPICIMSFASQVGATIPSVMYAVTAIVLLPINSSINPLIYSNGFEALRKRVSCTLCRRASDAPPNLKERCEATKM